MRTLHNAHITVVSDAMWLVYGGGGVCVCVCVCVVVCVCSVCGIVGVCYNTILNGDPSMSTYQCVT